MGSRLILPSHIQGWHQPKYIPRIDRSTSIGQALATSILASNWQVELVQGGISEYDIPEDISFAQGGAVKILPKDNNSNAIRWRHSNPGIDGIVGNSISIVYVGYMPSWNTTFRSFAIVGDNGFGSGWHINFFYGYVRFEVIDNTFNNDFRITDSKWRLPENTVFTAAATYDANTTTAKLYANGVLGKTKTDLVEPILGSGDQWISTQSNAVWWIACHSFNRVLTADEILWLHHNPYGVYAAPRRLYAKTSGAVTGTVHIKIAGVWKECETYIRVGGAWKLATPYIKIGGVWKELS